jgi:hypothetical protein
MLWWVTLQVHPPIRRGEDVTAPRRPPLNTSDSNPGPFTNTRGDAENANNSDLTGIVVRSRTPATTQEKTVPRLDPTDVTGGNLVVEMGRLGSRNWSSTNGE